MWLKKVVARIEGGLGNQLFQYAAARSLADRLGCELLLDLRGLAENGDRPYQLDQFKIRGSIADDQTLASLPSSRSSRASRIRSRIAQCLPAFCSYPVFWPGDFSYDRRFERISQPVFLVGYWQTEKYFAWNRSRLLQDLQLVAAAPAQEKLLERMRTSNSVALHVRRGDYVSNAAAAQFHGVCDMGYYQEAIRRLLATMPDLEVFVFSDEPEWARSNLNLPAPTHVIDSNGPDRGYWDLELMRHCRHHVIANSSFSWWGAWLAQPDGQVVYAPSRWFRDASTNTSDVIPSRWNLLQPGAV